jgi:hypothetical protein
MAFIIATTLIFAVGVVNQQTPNLSELIEILGSDTPMAKKREASGLLVAAGVDAIPVLIRALGDARVYEQRDIANRMNLPVTAKPPEPLMANISVGEHCEDLLYEIITPRHGSPYAGNFKVYSDQMLRVDDWEEWWAANEQKSLEQIRAELQPLVNEYWKQHGTTQTVGWIMGDTAEWVDGLPLPRGARRNDSLGGATSLGPGPNYVLRVYDVEASMHAITVFYERYLSDARRTTEGKEVRFETPRCYIKLASAGHKTRITLVIGPK